MTAEFAGQVITQNVRRAKTAVAEVPQPPAPDFTLSVTPPASRSIARSQSLAFTLTVTRMNSLTSPIRLSVEGLESDSDLTPSFSDAELTVSETETETTSTLTLAAGSNAAARTDQSESSPPASPVTRPSLTPPRSPSPSPGRISRS